MLFLAQFQSTAAVDITHQLHHRPRLLISKVRASSCCSDLFCLLALLNRDIMVRWWSEWQMWSSCLTFKPLHDREEGRGPIANETVEKSCYETPENTDGREVLLNTRTENNKGNNRDWERERDIWSEGQLGWQVCQILPWQHVNKDEQEENSSKVKVKKRQCQ